MGRYTDAQWQAEHCTWCEDCSNRWRELQHCYRDNYKVQIKVNYQPILPIKFVSFLIWSPFSRCVTALGCPTCSHLSTPSTSSSRYQTYMVLHNLHKISKDRFCRFFTDFARTKSLEEMLDFFHSYMNYCTHDSSRNFTDKPLFNPGQSGFATNFGHSVTGEGHRGVEGIVVSQTLKIFVSRLSLTLTDTTQSDNVVCKYVWAVLKYFPCFLSSPFKYQFNLAFTSCSIVTAHNPYSNVAWLCVFCIFL